MGEFTNLRGTPSYRGLVITRQQDTTFPHVMAKTDVTWYFKIARAFLKHHNHLAAQRQNQWAPFPKITNCRVVMFHEMTLTSVALRCSSALFICQEQALMNDATLKSGTHLTSVLHNNAVATFLCPCEDQFLATATLSSLYNLHGSDQSICKLSAFR